MKHRMMAISGCICLLSACIATARQTAMQSGSKPDWKAVDAAMGRAGQDQPDGTHKFMMPRSDLKVMVDGFRIKPGFALGAWVAFREMKGGAEVMGDLVLAEDEITPVMDKLIAAHIDISALHNHLLHETPRVMYMHVHGEGDAVALAKALHDALAETKTPPQSPPAATPGALSFDTKQVDSILGHAGKNNGGVYQFAVPRAAHVMEGGMPVPNSMGVATGINFQPAGAGKAAVTGDFVLIGSEVNPVIEALRQNGIAITALHSHMLEEQPRLFFMHFWAKDDALKLAKGLRAALDKTASQAPQ